MPALPVRVLAGLSAIRPNARGPPA
jgi:hypothetical protein